MNRHRAARAAWLSRRPQYRQARRIDWPLVATAAILFVAFTFGTVALLATIAG